MGGLSRRLAHQSNAGNTVMDQHAPCPVSAERFAEALRRTQAEFREMPGLKLTEAQAARLLSFDSALCSAVLSTLVDRRFLTRSRDTFQRAS